MAKKDLGPSTAIPQAITFDQWVHHLLNFFFGHWGNLNPPLKHLAGMTLHMALDSTYGGLSQACGWKPSTAYVRTDPVFWLQGIYSNLRSSNMAYTVRVSWSGVGTAKSIYGNHYHQAKNGVMTF